MTSPRRRGKAFAGAPGLLGGLWLVVACLGGVWAGGTAALATTTERVVANPRTGLAIEGFDPVAYFIDETATVGRPDFELRYRGAIWRFHNPGNRAVFVENPGEYEPRFGGYDPVAVGRGAPTPGNPEIWLILGGKLYLFYDPRTRDEFRSDPRRLLMQAEARWPNVVKVLSQ
jgi:hypothetical protein